MAKTSPMAAAQNSTTHRVCAYTLLVIGLQGLTIWAMLLRERLAAHGSLAASPLTWWAVFALVLAAALAFIGVGVLALRGKLQPFFTRASASHHWRRWLPVGVLVLLAAFIAKTSALITRFSYFDPLINHLSQTVGLWGSLIAIDLIAVYLLHYKGLLTRKGDRSLRLSFGVIFGIWLLVALTRFGLIPDTHFWNVASVPVLLNQLAAILGAAILIDLLFAWLSQRSGPTSKTFTRVALVLLCLVIWAGSVYLWTNAPVADGVFVYGPYPPNADFFPHSDAAVMDIAGQYMLIGERVEAPTYTDKPAYSIFLGLLRLISGQNYLQTTNTQILVFALMPVILFLLGKAFHGYFFGTAVALFAAVKEANAIFAMGSISVSNSRLLMTEFPTAMFMAALALALFLWLRQPERPKYWPVVAGGLLGLATLVRSNVLVLVPVLLLFIAIAYYFKLKQFGKPLLFFTAAILIVILPWLLYHRFTYGTDPYAFKIQAVLNTRFLNRPQQAPPVSVPLEGDPLFKNYRPGESPLGTEGSTGFPGKSLILPQTPPESGSITNALGTVAAHFLNNEIKALFTLPFQVYPLELTPVLELDYWKEPVIWQGALPFHHVLFFTANLALIALGLARAWQRFGSAGLVPLVINLGYYLSNAFARTSGSRYLLPADWTIFFYYLLGIASLYALILTVKQGAAVPEVSTVSESTKTSNGVAVAFALVLLVGLSLPMINTAFPKRYPALTAAQRIELLPLERIQSDLGLPPQELEAFLSQPNTQVLYGRALYPRWRERHGTEEIGLHLSVLTPALKDVFLPMLEPPTNPVPEGEDVLVLGCQTKVYFETYLAWFPGTERLISADGSLTSASCP